MNRAVYLGSGQQLRIEAPFVKMNKAQIIKKGLIIGVPYGLTWSCYEGGEMPCGVVVHAVTVLRHLQQTE